MRGQNNNWYRPKLERESIRLKQQRRREIGRGDTAMRAAFIAALARWAVRHAGDDTETPISIPSGTVTSTELTKVVLALIAIDNQTTSEIQPGHRADRPSTTSA
jgi:hypothetical protein